MNSNLCPDKNFGFEVILKYANQKQNNMDTKVYLMGLIISCPLNEAEPHCPLNRYRNTPITGLLELTNKLEAGEVISHIKYHKMCLKERLKSKRAS